MEILNFLLNTVKKKNIGLEIVKPITYCNSNINNDKKNKIGPLKKGDLIKYGYENVKDKTQRSRRIALGKAAKEFTDRSFPLAELKLV